MFLLEREESDGDLTPLIRANDIRQVLEHITDEGEYDRGQVLKISDDYERMAIAQWTPEVGWSVDSLVKFVEEFRFGFYPLLVAHEVNERFWAEAHDIKNNGYGWYVIPRLMQAIMTDGTLFIDHDNRFTDALYRVFGVDHTIWTYIENHHEAEANASG